MAQPSIVNYFNARKRAAIGDPKSIISKKVLILDNNNTSHNTITDGKDKLLIFNEEINKIDNVNSTVIPQEIVTNKSLIIDKRQGKTTLKARTRKKKEDGQKNIEQFLQLISASSKSNNVNSEYNSKEEKEESLMASLPPIEDTPKKAKVCDKELKLQALKEKLITSKRLKELASSMNRFNEKADKLDGIKNKNTQQVPPAEDVSNKETTNKNAMDKVNELTMNDIKTKLGRSAKLAELKASIARLKESDKKLEKIQQQKELKKKEENSPTIKSFKSLELEVPLSPQKVQSPQKQYLSPKKDSSTRRNIFNISSPTKNAVELSFSPSKLAYEVESKSLNLPFKYKSLLEIFRSIDTVSQIMFNRRETITFRKLKSAVEKLLKRKFFERHLAQINHIYPEAFDFRQEKIREFGASIHQEKWELTLYPNVNKDHITAESLLGRRQHLFQILIEKTKGYHDEFLKSIELNVSRAKLTRWHPEFDIEKVPDIEQGDLPKPPNEEKLHTGKEVLEKARSLFHCNARMEAALERLESRQENGNEETTPKIEPLSMKGIPKALLEKVRQRQAAKMLENMTRSDEKEKSLQMYSRLPELARLTRNLFVAEKKGVLPIDIVTDKLCNSFKTFLTKNEIEQYLRTISKEVPGWLVFHELRNAVYIKLSKNADLNLVLNKLETLLKEKEKV